jgi:hypothetical protein
MNFYPFHSFIKIIIEVIITIYLFFVNLVINFIKYRFIFIILVIFYVFIDRNCII